MAKVAMLLTQEFAEWEYALIGGAGAAFYGLEIQYFTPTPGELRSMGGLRSVVAQDLEALQNWQPDVVVVVGGSIWETDKAPDIRALLTAAYGKGAAIAGICGGTLALARAGLLDDRAHTSNEADFLVAHAPAYQGGAQYQASAAAVSCDRVITAPGIAPASFAAEVFQAAGLDGDSVAQFRGMLAAEHA